MLTNLTDVNGTLYFAAYTSANGFQVWQSNGTASGTVMDTGLAKGTTAPADLTAVGNDLYFTAPGATLWEWAPSASQSTPTISWSSPAGITYGTALTASQLDATASVGGSFTYSPASGTVPKAGTDTLSVTFTPTDTTDYTTVTKTVTIAVSQATPAIGWSSPSSIVYGTALTASQLDATASVGGSFTYSPASGTVLAAGTDTLSVTFTPTDTTDYSKVTKTVTIVVLPGSTATFLKEDTTTQGNWIGTYGSQGYDVIGNSASLPGYATITPAGQATYTWAASTTDQRARADRRRRGPDRGLLVPGDQFHRHRQPHRRPGARPGAVHGRLGQPSPGRAGADQQRDDGRGAVDPVDLVVHFRGVPGLRGER